MTSRDAPMRIKASSLSAARWVFCFSVESVLHSILVVNGIWEFRVFVMKVFGEFVCGVMDRWSCLVIRFCCVEVLNVFVKIFLMDW